MRKSKLIFESFNEWWQYIKKSLWYLLKGVTTIILSVVCGVFSFLLYVWRSVCRFIGKYPNIALGGFIAIAAIVWLLTFVKMRHRAVSAEEQRDSIAWQYTDFKQNHGYE